MLPVVVDSQRRLLLLLSKVPGHRWRQLSEVADRRRHLLLLLTVTALVEVCRLLLQLGVQLLLTIEVGGEAQLLLRVGVVRLLVYRHHLKPVSVSRSSR